MSKPSSWHSLVGLGFAVAGVSKLVSARPQVELFESWGWPKESMQAIGAAELFGAALLLTPATQRLGALLLTTTSGCVLQHEIQHGDDELVTPRAAMLVAALSGFLGGARKARKAARHAAPQAPVLVVREPLADVPSRTQAKASAAGAAAAEKAKALAGAAAGKAADVALGAACAVGSKTAGLAADAARSAGSAVASGAGKLATQAGCAAGRQARKWGRKAARQAARQAGRATDVAADYARQAAEKASERAKDVARAKGWA